MEMKRDGKVMEQEGTPDQTKALIPRMSRIYNLGNEDNSFYVRTQNSQMQ